MSVCRSECRELWREGETDVPDSVTPTIGLFLFFSLAPSSVLLLLSRDLSLVLPLALPSKPLSVVPPLSLSNLLAFIATATTSSRGFRSDVGTIEKSIRTRRSYLRCRYCRVAPFLRFLFFDLLSYRRMIDDGFTISYVTGSDKCTYTHSKMLN